MVNSKTYSVPERKTPYRSQYPNWTVLGIPNDHVYVPQGMGKITVDGKPLRSDGFSLCSALIIQNTRNFETALFHIDDIGLNYEQTPIVNQIVGSFISSQVQDISERERTIALTSAASRYWNLQAFGDKSYSLAERAAFKTRMTELNRDRILRAGFVRGDISRDVKRRVKEELLDRMGISISEDIVVDTGEYHWDIAFKPADSEILVNSRKQKSVLSFSF